MYLIVFHSFPQKNIMKGSSTIVYKRNHPLNNMNTYIKQDEFHYRSLIYSYQSPLDHVTVAYCNNKVNKKIIDHVFLRMIHDGSYDDQTQKRCISHALICNNFQVINLFAKRGFDLCNEKTLVHALSEFGNEYLSLAKYILKSQRFSHCNLQVYTPQKTKRRRLWN